MLVSRTLLVVPAFVLATTVLTGLASWAGYPPFWWFPFQDFLFSPFDLEFGFGIAAYWIIRRYPVRIPPVGLGAGVCLVLLTGEFAAPSDFWLRVWGFGIPSTLLLMYVVQRETAGRALYPVWLLKLGNASYILYLVHVPAIMVLTHALLMLRWPQTILPANFALIGFLSWLSWQLHQRVEKPLLRWLHSRPALSGASQHRPAKRYLLRLTTGKPPSTPEIIVP